MSLLSGCCPVCVGPSVFIRSRQCDLMALECVNCGTTLPVMRTQDEAERSRPSVAELEEIFDVLTMADRRPT